MSAEFDDGKDEGALRTIGEVAKALDIKQHVLRYWEQQFPMLQPLKRSGGRRYYRPDDIALVEEIDRLVNREGYTLKGAKKALSGKGKPAATQSDEPRQDTQVTEPESPAPAPAAEQRDLPSDGGVDAFFGRTDEADGQGDEGTSPQPVPEAASVSPEVIAQLKSIRARLAAALDA